VAKKKERILRYGGLRVATFRRTLFALPA
jgi:hypothetical protein